LGNLLIIEDQVAKKLSFSRLPRVPERQVFLFQVVLVLELLEMDVDGRRDLAVLLGWFLKLDLGEGGVMATRRFLSLVLAG
jgi:hypothetical protein